MSAATTPDVPPAACANCGQAFDDPPPNFCPACGQESRVRAPRMGDFLQQFGGAYFSTEGALWRTLKLLLLKPGELTRQYLAGRRKHYVLPLRLYLTISLVTLLLMRISAGLGGDEAFKFDVDLRTGEYSILTFGDGAGAGIKQGVFYCKGMPAWVCKRLERRLDTDPKGLQRQAAELTGRAISNLGAAMFVLLPLFAALLKLAYLNRKLRYTEHLVFALHLHAFWFLMLALMLRDLKWLTGLAFMAVPVYGCWAMRRVYGGRWWPLLLRVGLISMLYLLALALAMVAVALWTLVS